MTCSEACDRDVRPKELERNAWDRLVYALSCLMSVLLRQSVVVCLCVSSLVQWVKSCLHTPPDLQMNSPFKFDYLLNLRISTNLHLFISLSLSLLSLGYLLSWSVSLDYFIYYSKGFLGFGVWGCLHCCSVATPSQLLVWRWDLCVLVL